MIFSKKKITTDYTIEYCRFCQKENRRKFKIGDMLFLESGQCNTCQKKMIIEKIYGEITE